MKKNLKAILTSAIALTLCATMVGCGESKKNTDDITEKEIEQALENMDKENNKNKNSSVSSEEIDPFENLTVTFGGISPDSSVQISGGNSSVTYTPDVKSGMKNGDVITITAKSEYSNILLEETEKEYTVDGLSAYAISLDEIPSEIKDKMQQQANDAITASCASWRDGNSLNRLDFMGFYFLSGKEGFSQKPYNQLYCVFKASTTVTGLKKGGDGETQETGDEIYYTNYSYSDIMLLNDGTCSVDFSAGAITSNITESDYGYRDLITQAYIYHGFKDLDSMFNECVSKNIGNYNYETTVEQLEETD